MIISKTTRSFLPPRHCPAGYAAAAHGEERECHLVLDGEYPFWCLAKPLPKLLSTPYVQCNNAKCRADAKGSPDSYHITQRNGLCQVLDVVVFC